MNRFSGSGLGGMRGERLLFSRLDFAVSAGGMLLLTGPNGSGKSSLLRIMAGLAAPVAGMLAWNDAPIARDVTAHARRLGYLGHHDALKPALTAAENLDFWLGLAASPPPGVLAGKAAGKAAGMAALERMGIAALADFPVRLLSAGQCRRLALARFVPGAAPLWLLDEPTAGLDEAAKSAFAALLDDHMAAGGMAVVASHEEIGAPTAHLDLAGGMGAVL